MAFSEIAQAVSTFALGAAGCLSMVKLLQVIERKRAKTNVRSSDQESEPEQRKRTSPLFPNGEREQILFAIDELKASNRANRREHTDLKSDVARIAEHLGIQL